MSAHVLDNAGWAALSGPHAHLAEAYGQVLRYPADMSIFAAFRDGPTEAAWADLAHLAGPGTEVALIGLTEGTPEGWEITYAGSGVQLVDTSLAVAEDPQAVPLGPDDVPEMLDLVARTEPGPFEQRTIELGRYLGIRRDGVLVAMAGERMHPPGWVEISAVCTDAAYRGQGLATRLVRAVAAGIRDRGATPYLHAATSNTNAIRLYLELGFTLRRTTTFTALRVPAQTV